MLKENLILFESLVKVLEQKIEVARLGYQDDYKDGVVDGLIIAIQTIENMH